jgi:hypothetical protein
MVKKECGVERMGMRGSMMEESQVNKAVEVGTLISILRARPGNDKHAAGTDVESYGLYFIAAASTCTVERVLICTFPF